jgi:hypothetical protein
VTVVGDRDDLLLRLAKAKGVVAMQAVVMSHAHQLRDPGRDAFVKG